MTVRLIDLPPATPKVVTPIWALTKDARRIEAELVEQGAAGWELRLMTNREWVSGRRFKHRLQAVAHAVETRRELLSRGWSPSTHS